MNVANAHLQERVIFEKKQAFDAALEKYWGLDHHTVAFLRRYFNPFLETKAFHPLIDDFIAKLHAFQIRFPSTKKLIPFPLEDGVIAARSFHTVIFENPYVRLLAGQAEPGERDPFHLHAWKSLLVVFEKAAYWIEYADGTSEHVVLNPDVYEHPPEGPYTCTKEGTTWKNCLRFEVKD